MSDSLLQLLRFFFDEEDNNDDPMETQPRNYPNRGVVVVAQRNATLKELPHASFNNTATQNMRGVIKNTGYTKGIGNGSIIFGDFGSSPRTYKK